MVLGSELAASVGICCGVDGGGVRACAGTGAGCSRRYWWWCCRRSFFLATVLASCTYLLEIPVRHNRVLFVQRFLPAATVCTVLGGPDVASRTSIIYTKKVAGVYFVPGSVVFSLSIYSPDYYRVLCSPVFRYCCNCNTGYVYRQVY